MTKPYDPIDYDTWPESQKDFAGEVWRGLHDGNLAPLAAYLRAGHQLDKTLADDLASAIDGKDVAGVRIKASRPRGKPKMSASIDAHRFRMEVGLYIERRIRELGPSGYEAAIADARAHYGFTEKTSRPRDCHSYVKTLIEKQSRDGDWDPFEVYCRIYSS